MRERERTRERASAREKERSRSREVITGINLSVSTEHKNDY